MASFKNGKAIRRARDKGLREVRKQNRHKRFRENVADFKDALQQKREYKLRRGEQKSRNLKTRTTSRNIIAAGTATGEATAGPTTAAAYNVSSRRNNDDDTRQISPAATVLDRGTLGNQEVDAFTSDEWSQDYRMR